MGVGAIELGIAVAGIGAALLLMWPRLAEAPLWRATITPLASIIGSGFLILGPVLVDSFGSYAVAAMAALCLAGYAFGAAIRFNIAAIERDGREDGLVLRFERIASWALAFAYVISVAYYLNLLGAFAARLTDHPTPELGRTITTSAYVAILAAGMTRGFGLLERLEQVSVSLKLAIIAALLGALVPYAWQHWETGTLHESRSQVSGFALVQMLFGMIVTVQGFETSRYLERYYPAALRIRSMRLSQAISTAIYLAYVLLLSLCFDSGSFTLSETAIIDLMHGVSTVLGPLLIIAALSAQFSAAVADTAGSGGLVRELTGGRMGAKGGYALLVGAGLVLTWSANVFEIVSFASRAFAFYYAVQAAIAFIRARALEGAGPRRMALVVGSGALALFGLAAAVLAVPVEG